MATPVNPAALPPVTAPLAEVFGMLQAGKMTPEQYTAWDALRVAALCSSAAAEAAAKAKTTARIPKDAHKIAAGRFGLKVAENSGWLTIYWGGQFPTSLPVDIAEGLLAAAGEIGTYIANNRDKFSTGRDDTAARKAAAAAKAAQQAAADQAAALAAQQRLDAAAAQNRAAAAQHASAKV